MSSLSPLDPAWEAYLITHECLLVAEHYVCGSGSRLVTGTRFDGKTTAESKALLNEARENMDRIAIVAMWAEFEQFLTAFMRSKVSHIAHHPPLAFSPSYETELSNRIERWPIEEKLNLFQQTIVDKTLIISAKQIKYFRDWVAHRNPKKGSPAKTDPRTAYSVLTDIIEQINKA